MNIYPELYKFASWELNMHSDRVNWNRQTYSLLDWLGDLGGLVESLFFIFHLVVNSVSAFSLQTRLAESLFSIKKRSRKSS